MNRGDFQTPAALAAAVWERVDVSGVDVILEPTVGLGAFLEVAPPAARALPWVAYDIEPEYVAHTRALAASLGVEATVECRSAFALPRLGLPGKVVLAVGNPPWVTNAAQNGTVAPNLPAKWNRFGLSGLDAATGKSNFDIAEAVLLSVLDALGTAREVRLAFLLKRSVAMKMLRDVLGKPGVVAASLTRVDARSWFGVSVEAVLLELTLRPASDATIDRVQGSAVGLVAGRFTHDVDGYAALQAFEAADGPELHWRQGIKHDATRVLELRRDGDRLVNGFGERVDVEPEALAPLYKGSDVAAGRPASRVFPLYQHDLAGPLPDLEQRWPKLHAYLETHFERFAARASSIYRGKPNFMLFGVGPYTLAPYKVAVSGFYKDPHFRVLAADDRGQPPLVDDTCYLLPYDEREPAEAMAHHLNSAGVQRFLASIADRTAKRPYTKDVLARISQRRDISV